MLHRLKDKCCKKDSNMSKQSKVKVNSIKTQPNADPQLYCIWHNEEPMKLALSASIGKFAQHVCLLHTVYWWSHCTATMRSLTMLCRKLRASLEFDENNARERKRADVFDAMVQPLLANRRLARYVISATNWSGDHHYTLMWSAVMGWFHCVIIAFNQLECAVCPVRNYTMWMANIKNGRKKSIKRALLKATTA